MIESILLAMAAFCGLNWMENGRRGWTAALLGVGAVAAGVVDLSRHPGYAGPVVVLSLALLPVTALAHWRGWSLTRHGLVVVTVALALVIASAPQDFARVFEDGFRDGLRNDTAKMERP